MAIPMRVAQYFLVCLALLPSNVLAVNTVVLQEKATTYPVRPYLEYLADQENRWTIHDVSSAAFDKRFAESDEETPNFGYTTTPFWFRLELRSELPERQKLLAEVPFPVLDQIDLYVERADGTFAMTTVGDIFPYGNKVVRHRNFLFPLQIEPGEHKRIYLRVETQGVLQVPFNLWTPESFLDYEHVVQLLLGVLCGFAIVMALYNLFIFLATGDRSYLYLVLFIFSGIFCGFTFLGLAQEYFWPTWPWFGNRVLPLSLYAMMLFMWLFAEKFLDLREHWPGVVNAFSALIIVSLAGFVTSFFGPYNLMVILVPIIALIGAVFALAAPIVVWRRGFKPARYYIAAWSVYLFSALIMALNKLGLFPRTLFTEYGLVMSFSVTVVLLSLALADRINVLRREKEQAQARALDVQRQAAENLEREVQKRTQELEQAYDDLAEHDRLKSRFFSNVSHEVRTPLTLILTPLERLLVSEDLSFPVRDKIRAVLGNTQRLIRLVNQLLDFARLESGGTTVSYERIDVRIFVESITRAFEPFARSKGLKLDLRGTDVLPQIYTDAVKLDKVLSNLLSNACKFTDEGGWVIVRLSADDSSLTISVRDTGIGIGEEDLPHIFERFRQVDGGPSRRFGGTGIGLALSKELTEMISGELRVESEIGAGSTFFVTLPLGKKHLPDSEGVGAERGDSMEVPSAKVASVALASEVGIKVISEQEARRAEHAADSATESKPAAEPRMAAPEDITQEAAKPQVLVVEDNPDMRALVSEICQEEFDVLLADNGQQGLELIRHHRPDLVITDIMMPEVDGIELLQQVRSEPSTASIPVIMLTARAGSEMMLDGLESGADDFLSKPFNARELLARSRNLVRLKQQERDLRHITTKLQQKVVSQASALERARVLERYLPSDVARSILEEGEGIRVGQQRSRLTVFQLELRGFDKLVDSVIAPEDMAAMLNGYLSEMMEVAFAHGATVDKFIRYTVVGFFGAPRSEGPERDALRGAELAIAMWERAVEICGRWREVLESPPPIPTVALASGYATVGHFGSSRRLEYTAVGGPLDEAASLLPMVRDGVVACSQSTWGLIQEKIEGEYIGEVTFRHRGRPAKIYRIAGPPSLILSHVEPTTTQPPVKSAFVSMVGSERKLGLGSVLSDRYEIVSLLGEGGMGAVYLARDLKVAADVALKVMRRDTGADDAKRARLYREVRLARLISHRNVARIYDLGEWEGYEFISMEYIKGKTLEQQLSQDGAFSLEDGQHVLRELCNGLAAAHTAGIVHRDLKPANIMLEQGDRVVILDFGIARWVTGLHQTRTEEEHAVGTPWYMAPEQFTSDNVDHRADIYALGVVAFELFTGIRPFRSDNLARLAYMHTSEPPPDPIKLRPDLPSQLAAVIYGCLEKSPRERFSTVAEVVSLIDRD